MLADRTREPAVIAYAQWLVTLTDRIFTAGGVVLIVIGAYGMAAVGGLDLRQTWLMWGQSLFLLSGLIWVAVLFRPDCAGAPGAGVCGGRPIPDSYWRLGRRWAIWGVIATIIPLCNLYFMVLSREFCCRLVPSPRPFREGHFARCERADEGQSS